MRSVQSVFLEQGQGAKCRRCNEAFSLLENLVRARDPNFKAPQSP